MPAAATRWTATASSRPLPDGRHHVVVAATCSRPRRGFLREPRCRRCGRGCGRSCYGKSARAREKGAGHGAGGPLRRRPPRTGHERGRRCWGVTRGGPDGRGHLGSTRGGSGDGVGEVARERRPARAQLGAGGSRERRPLPFWRARVSRTARRKIRQRDWLALARSLKSAMLVVPVIFLDPDEQGRRRQ